MAILPDLMPRGLVLVICGSAAGTASARAGAYYAGAGNRFWATLHATGLTPTRFEPADFSRLVDCGIGLTDVSKTRYGMDHQLGDDPYDALRFWSAVSEADPAFLAFNGKRAAAVALGVATRELAYGALATEERPTWVLPSTSGAASRYWDLATWQALAAAVLERRLS